MRRPLGELLGVQDPAWPLVKGWLEKAGALAQAQKPDPADSESELLACQVTVRSVLGALVYYTGGVLVDSGWLKILGTRSPGCPWSVSEVTESLGWSRADDPPAAVAVGLDVLGGVFAINGGGIASESLGSVFYFDPGRVGWEDLKTPHSRWVASMLEPSLCTEFYQDMRWLGWEQEVRSLPPTHGIGIYPPLWSGESRPIVNASRKPTPLDELFRLNFEYARQLGHPRK